MSKKKGITAQAANYFRRVYRMKQTDSITMVALKVAEHKGETLPLGMRLFDYQQYVVKHAPEKIHKHHERQNAKRRTRKEKRQARKQGRSALGFKHLPRQTKTWIDPEKYEKFYSSREWRELRYLALKNTDGRCECCGAAAKDGASLHVDHIKPRASRPDLQLSLSNLQVLCVDCNIGKGAWDDTNWKAHMDDITRH